MIQAHRYAHGMDGRPDLADAHLDHAHNRTPRKPFRVGKFMLLIVVFFIVGAIAVGASTSGTLASATRPATHTVTYKVEGTTKGASITYENSSGDTSQQSDVDVPLTRKSDGGHGIELYNMHGGDFLYISAQNNQEYGSVTCIIEVDGVVVKRNTSSGGFTIATCSGRL